MKQTKPRILKSHSLILLLAIFSFQAISSAIWLSLDKSFYINDAHDHYMVSFLIYYKVKFLGTIPQFLTDNLTGYIKWHGTFVESITAFLHFLFPFKLNAFLTQLFFLAILILFTYRLGSHFFGKTCGLLASYMVSMYPIISAHTRLYLVDLPLTALFTASTYYLLISLHSFTKKNIALFLVCSCCAALTKLNFLLFIIGPIIYGILYLLTSPSKPHQKHPIKLIIAGILMPTLLFFLIFSQSLKPLMIRIFNCSWLSAYYQARSIKSLVTIFYNGLDYFFWLFYELFNSAISSLPMLLFLIGFVLLLIKESPQKKYFFLLTIIPPLFVLGFLFHIEYDIRYVMPLLPFFSIIAAHTINTLRNKLVQSLTILAIILFSLTSHYYFFFSPTQNTRTIPGSSTITQLFRAHTIKNSLHLEPEKFYKPEFVTYNLYIFPQRGENLFRNALSFIPSTRSPEPREKTINKILAIIKQKTPVQTFFIGKNRYTYQSLIQKSTINQYPIKFSKAENQYSSLESLKEAIKRSHFLCISTQQEKDIYVQSDFENEQVLKNIKALNEWIKKQDQFKYVETIPLDKTNSLAIYRRINQ